MTHAELLATCTAGWIFTSESVRGIAAGTKTQTRRLCKKAIDHGEPATCVHPDGSGTGWIAWWGQAVSAEQTVRLYPCADGFRPRYQVGKRYYVKEAWREWEVFCHGDHDGECGPHCHQIYVAYAATPRIGYRPRPDQARICYLDESTPLDANPELCKPWLSPMFMPREYARYVLEVTNVRAQRLRDISPADILAEGIADRFDGQQGIKQHFFDAWDEINGERCPAANSPWVWAYTVRRVEP